jgi:hypothetical protein
VTIAIALVAWAALLVLVVGACAAASRGESASVDTAEAPSTVPHMWPADAQETSADLERAA